MTKIDGKSYDSCKTCKFRKHSNCKKNDEYVTLEDWCSAYKRKRKDFSQNHLTQDNLFEVKKPREMKLIWHDSTQALPEKLRDVLGYNMDTNQIELGFRSGLDTHATDWIDFSFKVTHWAYINPWEIEG